MSFASENPFEKFAAWLAQAEKTELNDPNAMSLATVDQTGMPNLRMVLLKEVTEEGFLFYTNFESQKGQELTHTPKAALCFHWKTLRKQVRVRGNVQVVSQEEADHYFASRPRNSRIGAWASQQSRPLESRFALEKAVAQWLARYPVGDVPRPPYWGGFCLVPLSIEFWEDRPFRLHDRQVFSRLTSKDPWEVVFLYP